MYCYHNVIIIIIIRVYCYHIINIIIIIIIVINIIDKKILLSYGYYIIACDIQWSILHLATNAVECL